MSKKLIKSIKGHFKRLYNIDPLCVFSPGRINLIGEHTDYNEGFVFPAAINKGIGLAIAESESNNSNVYALDEEDHFKFNMDTISPILNGGWRNYILGVVAELQKCHFSIGNFNAVFSGNIPSGAGLSSSAALENSFVFGLNELFNLGLTRSEMIIISQNAEHEYAGVKCGIMDQYASMFGIKNNALLLDCRTIESIPFKIDFKNYRLMLINTHVKHDLSESAYNDRRGVCESVSKRLKLKTLRDASKSDLDTIKYEISEDDYQKALYIIEENLRVKEFSRAIENEDLNTLGQLLFKSHRGLSLQYKVSCKELDFLVDKAKENVHVLGSRMMGGGFGGCTINLVESSKFKTFKKEVSMQFQKEFGRACSVYKVKLSAGTRIIES